MFLELEKCYKKGQNILIGLQSRWSMGANGAQL